MEQKEENVTVTVREGAGAGWQWCGGGGWGYRIYKAQKTHVWTCDPVWPSGKALGWYTEGHRFESASAVLSLQKLWSVDTCLVNLSLTINKTLKWLSS